MLENLSGLPEGIDGVAAVGEVTKRDYETVLEPLLDAAKARGRRVRLLYRIGPEFARFTPGAAWEDAKLGLRSLNLLEGCAVVTDVKYIRDSIDLMAFLSPCPIRVFENARLEEAVVWLAQLPGPSTIPHRLIPDSGVLVVEPDRPLRVEDFESLSRTADSWVEAHGNLTGVVVHAKRFPGWANLGSLVRHMAFVRKRSQNVERIALAVDGRVARIAPRIARRLLDANVKGFGYTELDAAIAWAGNSLSAAKPREGSARPTRSSEAAAPNRPA